MTDDEILWASQVNNLIRAHAFTKFVAPPAIDVAIAHQLGFTPTETADALVGRNPRVFDAIILHMRSTDAYNLDFQ